MTVLTLRASGALMCCLALLAMVAGCATGGAEKKSAIASLQTVYIESLPNRLPALMTRTQMNAAGLGGAIGGAVGGAIAGAGANQGEVGKLRDLVKKEGVVTHEIVAAALRGELERRNIVAVTDVRE